MSEVDGYICCRVPPQYPLISDNVFLFVLCIWSYDFACCLLVHLQELFGICEFVVFDAGQDVNLLLSNPCGSCAKSSMWWWIFVGTVRGVPRTVVGLCSSSF